MAPRKHARDGSHLPPAKHARRDQARAPSPSQQQWGTSSSLSSNSHTYQAAVPSSLRDPSSQAGPRSSWVADDDEHEVIDLIQSDDTRSPVELYGTFDNNIVGVRYYNGVITPGEMVLCRREPQNPYDGNAIRVDNVMRIQVGHLPRTIASRLAPLIDNNDIVLEGVVTGYKDTFTCPIKLYVYGTSEPSARLEIENKLKATRLLTATQLKGSRQEAEARRKASQLGLKSGSSQAGLPQENEGQNVPVQELLGTSQMTDTRAEDSFKDLAMDEDALSKLPKAPQPEQLVSELLPYQLQVYRGISRTYDCLTKKSLGSLLDDCQRGTSATCTRFQGYCPVMEA